MPAPLQGRVTWVGDHYTTRVRDADKKRRTVHFPPGLTEAEAVALAIDAARDAKHSVKDDPDAPRLPADAETFGAYVTRWFAERAARGLRGVPSDRSRMSVHVVPRLGQLPIAAVTREHLEDLVLALDAQVRKPAAGQRPMAWKNARNIWGLVTQLFDDATSHKDRAFRVCATNPTTGVRGPDRGRNKARTYVYPSELLQLVACAAIPRAWRRLYVVAVYLYARAGELAGLTWEDFDMAHGTVHIHRAWNHATRAFEDPKTEAGNRTVPLEPALMPLLRAMHLEAKGTGPVFRIAWKRMGRPPADSGMLADPKAWAAILAAHLAEAGLTRAALFENDAGRKSLVFHDLRSSGVTWCAVRGDALNLLRARAGHEDIATTDGYIREAENLRANFGAVFPPLPAELIGQRMDTGGSEGGQSGPVGGSRENAGRGTTAKGGDAAEPTVFKSPSSHRENTSAHGALAETEPPGCPMDVQSTPRAALVAQLAAAVAALASVGDLSAARIAATALQALLVTPEGEPARVVDLALERERRER